MMAPALFEVKLRTMPSSERLEFDLSIGEAAVQVETSARSPDVVEEYLGGTPVGDPAKDHDAFGEQLNRYPLRKDCSNNLAEPDRRRKYSDADSERAPADTE